MKALITSRMNRISGNGHSNGRQKSMKAEVAAKTSGGHVSLRITEAAPKTLKVDANRKQRQPERKGGSPWLNPTQLGRPALRRSDARHR